MSTCVSYGADFALGVFNQSIKCTYCDNFTCRIIN